MNTKIKEPHEFTPEEAYRFIKAILEYQPESRWERLNNWLAKVVRRRNR